MTSFSNPVFSGPKGHPFIQKATLFTTILPTGTTEAQVLTLWQEFGVADKPNVSLKQGRPPPFKEQFARLDFQSIQAGTCLLYRLNAFAYSVSAELALAVLDGAPIPESVPLATLSLSAIAPNFPSPTRPKPEALPRLIQVLDFKPIPHVTDMFYNLRTYGPIHSLKLDTPIGCVVKFWHESNALVAQMKPVDVAGTKVKLDAYDPNTIFCNVITRTISSMYDY